jgi:hypothetical protein
MRLPADLSWSEQADQQGRCEGNIVDDQPPRLAQLLSSHPS